MFSSCLHTIPCKHTNTSFRSCLAHTWQWLDLTTYKHQIEHGQNWINFLYTFSFWFYTLPTSKTSIWHSIKYWHSFRILSVWICKCNCWEGNHHHQEHPGQSPQLWHPWLELWWPEKWNVLEWWCCKESEAHWGKKWREIDRPDKCCSFLWMHENIMYDPISCQRGWMVLQHVSSICMIKKN